MSRRPFYLTAAVPAPDEPRTSPTFATTLPWGGPLLLTGYAVDPTGEDLLYLCDALDSARVSAAGGVLEVWNLEEEFLRLAKARGLRVVTSNHYDMFPVGCGPDRPWSYCYVVGKRAVEARWAYGGLTYHPLDVFLDQTLASLVVEPPGLVHF